MTVVLECINLLANFHPQPDISYIEVTLSFTLVNTPEHPSVPYI